MYSQMYQFRKNIVSFDVSVIGCFLIDVDSSKRNTFFEKE